MSREDEKINVWGARVHNLKNIDVEIPRNSLTVITGLSGSGKSSLALRPNGVFYFMENHHIAPFLSYIKS